MQFKVLALDLDGTIAMNDKVELETLQVLRDAKKSGFSIILVTGRRLIDIAQLGPFEELCEALVAEDGAAIYFPSTQSVSLPFGHLAPEVTANLIKMDIPLDRGMAILSTWVPHDKQVIEALAATGYAATIEYNKGAVMVLPPGATKGTGLIIALRELGYSTHNVIAFGDAENDRSLFEQVELAVAVENASPGIKELADIQLEERNGKGVRNFIRKLIEGEKPKKIRVRPRRKLTLGLFADGQEMSIHPLVLTSGNLGIFGVSGSGKSWLGGLIAEKLLRLEYQICVVDPEGDYRGIKAFPNTLLLGGSDSLPPNSSVVSTLLEYSNMSLVLDLSQYKHPEKVEYVNDLLITLSNLKERRGKPHWFLIDEIHYFCQEDNNPITRLLADRMESGGFTIVSYEPSLIAPSLIKKLDHLMLTRIEQQQDMDLIKAYTIDHGLPLCNFAELQALSNRHAYFFIKGGATECGKDQGIVEFDSTSKQVPHIRHLHKYLRAPLPLNKQFYFNKSGPNGSALKATSMYDFLRIIPQVPLESINYHLHRSDFEKWIKYTLHDLELAKRIRKIANRKLEGELLRHSLTEAISSRYEELEKLV
jgi:hydroxymethylpyrimidine pyrophosphatase-like HAD family hydrolase